MKHANYSRLYLYFHTDCGEVAVTLMNPRKDITKEIAIAEAERLMKTYRTKKGLRLKYFKRAVVKHTGETVIR